jgi:hypothetical protein
MPQCQFIFLRQSKTGSLQGGQCLEEGQYVNETLCLSHKSKKTTLSDPRRLQTISQTQGSPSDSDDTRFPRIAQPHEILEWVEAARTATDPIENRRGSCLFCGQFLDLRTDLTMTMIDDVVRFKRLVEGSSAAAYYSHVPSHHFSHPSISHAGIDDLPLCRRAFLAELPVNSADRDGPTPIAYSCHDCLGSVSSGKLPTHSLANALWTGAGEVPELSGLSFIEEKILARVHISITLFKCRLFPLMRLDDFYSQPRVRGHITSYPVDPQTVATHLPLTIDKLVGIIKIIFISSRKVRFRDVCQLRFFVVRRRRVQDALEWLVRWNPLYKDVQIDGTALSSLPIDGMVPELFTESGHSTRVDLDDASHSRYDRPDGPSAREHRSVPGDDGAWTQDDEEIVESGPEESSGHSTSGEDVTDTAHKGSLPHSGITRRLQRLIHFSDFTLDSGNDSMMESHRLEEPRESIVELHCCGIVDTVGTSLPMESKFNQALQAIYIPHVAGEHSFIPNEFPSHLYKEPASFLSKKHGQDDLWEIRFNNRTFANEYDPRHLPSAFPSLFPFGVGGIQDPLRPVPLRSMDKHIRVLLQQSHEAFARHEIFIFVAFNILQRRQICLGSKLVAAQRLLPDVCQLLRNLDYDTVSKALQDIKSTSGRLPSTVDPRIKKLMELTAIASAGCRGGLEYFQQRRVEIKALFVRFGGPHFFITVNPDDSKHPLVLSFSPSTLNAGSQQSFVVSIPHNSHLRRQRRFKLVAQNPVIQAQFFDKVFTAVVYHLLGFGRENRIGILGKVSSYYALVEAQGKGTLHAHTLVWLSDGNSYLLQPLFRQS